MLYHNSKIEKEWQNFLSKDELSLSERQYEFVKKYLEERKYKIENLTVEELSFITNLLEKSAGAGDYYAKWALSGIYYKDLIDGKGIEDAKKLMLEVVSDKSDVDQQTKSKAYFCLGEITEIVAEGDNYIEEAIEYYLQSEKLNEKNHLLNYRALLVAYINLYYKTVATMKLRKDLQTYKFKEYKDKANEYLTKYEDSLNEISDAQIKEIYQRNLKTYKSVLAENKLKLNFLEANEIAYGLVWKIKKSSWLTEYECNDLIFAVGEYFARKDKKEKETEKEIKKIGKPKTKKMLYDVAEEFWGKDEIKENFITSYSELFKKIKNDIDSRWNFSSCVVNFNKYIEKVLKMIFEDGFNKFKEEKRKQQSSNEKKDDIANDQLENKINTLQADIANNLKEMDTNWENVFDDVSAKEFFGKMSGKPSKISSNKVWSTMKNILQRNLSNDYVNNLRSYKEELDKRFEDSNDVVEIKRIVKIEKFIDKLLIMVEKKKNLKNLEDEKNNKKTGADEKLSENNKEFTMGSLYYEVFKGGRLNEEIVEFVKSISPNNSESKIKLMLSELATKIELYRVIVRNPSSHTEYLTQEACEEGLNLCIFQTGSIFELINNLFGDYLKENNVGKCYSQEEQARLVCKYIKQKNGTKNLDEINDNSVGI